MFILGFSEENRDGDCGPKIHMVADHEEEAGQLITEYLNMASPEVIRFRVTINRVQKRSS